MMETPSEQSGVPYIDVDALLPEPEVLKIFNNDIWFYLPNKGYL